MRLLRLSTNGLDCLDLSLEGLDLVRREGASFDALRETGRTHTADAEGAAAALQAAVAAARAEGASPAITPPPVAVAFYGERFFAELKARGARPRKKPTALLAEAEARYGQRFPEELRALLAFADAHETERADFGEWRGPGTGLMPVKAGANALATAMELDRKNYLGTAVLEHLAGLVPIGTAGNGDVYFAHVDAAHPEACEVYLWDHEERDLRPFADSITSFAWLSWLYLMDHGDVETPDDTDLLDTLRAGFEPLAAHVSPSWHFRSTVEHAGVECAFEPVTAALFCYARSLWIDQLTRAARPDAAEAKGFFFENLEGWHARNTWESARQGPRLRVSIPPVYWLFYLTFFGDAAALAAACADLATSQASFARDAAALFAALAADLAAGGKGALGKLKPVKPLLKAFRAAETQKAKRAREAAEAAAAAEQRRRDEALGAQLLAAAGGDTAAVWAALEANAARPGVVEVLVAHLADTSPSLRETLARLDVLADGQRYRDHKSAMEWLAWHGDRAATPLLRVRGLRGPLASFAAVDTPAPPAPPPVPEFTAETFEGVRSTDAIAALLALTHPDRAPATDPAERARDASALASLDASLARHRGHSGFMLGVRLLRAALAERLGQAFDLDSARSVLAFASSDVDLTAALHALALRLLARHAPDEGRAAALRALTFDLSPVRAAARRVLAEAGARATPRVIDTTAAAELCARGVGAVREALADPHVRPLHPLIGAAVAAGLGPELAADAAAAIRARYDVLRAGHGYFSSRYSDLCDAAGALIEIAGPDVDAFAHWGVHHPAPVVRAAFERDARARADAHGPAPTSAVGRPPAAAISAVAAPPDALGGTVHGLAVAGPWVVAAGNGRSARFDADGRGAPLPPDVVGGWAYVADAHPDGRRVALGYHACHVVVIDAETGELRARTQVGGVPSGVRTLRWSPDGRFLATGSDDQSLRVLDAETLAEVGRHAEPYDVNGVDWLDDSTLVCVTDHHLVRLPWGPGGFGEPARTDVGGGAEVRRLGDLLAVGSQKRGLLLLDPDTLKTRRTLPLKLVSRARRSPDGAVLWATCYEGETAGLWRFDLTDAQSGGEHILTEGLFGLDVTADGGAVAGGKAGRVHRFGPDGTARGAGGLLHTGPIMRLRVAALEGAPRVDALDNNGRVLRWDLETGTPTAPWAQPEPLTSAEDFVVGPGGELVVSSMDALCLTPASGPERFRQAARRSEAVLLCGGVIVAGDGPRLAFVDPQTGERLATETAGVTSSWLPHLLPVDADTFVALGYDDPGVARWSASARSVVVRRAHRVVEDDGRYSRTYGVAAGPRHLFLAHWNHTIHALDPATLEGRYVVDVSNSYGVLAVDATERHLLATTGGLADVYDLATGALVGRALAPAEIKAAVSVGPGDFVVGLANGELHRVTVGPA